MGLVMPPGFHSAARWLDLCCEGIQKLISKGGLHECEAPCNRMAEIQLRIVGIIFVIYS